MYKGRSESMQRGTYLRDREYISNDELYKGYKFTLTREEEAHFLLNLRDRETFLTRLRPTIRGYALNGFRKPRDVARLLNKRGITTACGARWTRRLAWFLLRFLFDDTRKVTTKSQVGLSPSKRQKSAPTQTVSGRKATVLPPHKFGSLRVTTSGRVPLTKEERARRLAVIGRKVPIT